MILKNRIILCMILILGLCIRFYLIHYDDGIFWPDEIYQSLEQAHRLVYDYGLIGWEYIVGARPWVLPAVMAAVLKLIQVVPHGQEPEVYLIIVKLFLNLIVLGTALGVYCFSRGLTLSREASTLNTAFFFLAVPVIYFSSRGFAEVVATFPLIWGFFFVLTSDTKTSKRCLGLSLIGFSVLLRLHYALFCIFFLLFYLIQKKWRKACEALAIFLVWAFLLGLIDRLTWGDWFQSSLIYLNANVAEDKASTFGTEPFIYYLSTFWASMPSSTLLLGATLPYSCRIKSLRMPLLCGIAFLFIHSLIPHKEFRFIFATLPLLSLSLGAALDKLKKPLLYPIGLVSILCSLLSLPSLTFAKMGYKEDTSSAFNKSGAINRLLMSLHHQEDACGVLVERTPLEWTGGYSTLHKAIPIYSTRKKYPEHEAYFNYIITQREAKEAEILVSVDHEWKLLKKSFSCEEDNAYDWKIP